MYVYIRSEPGLWTVGHYRPSDNRWMPESDHGDREEAAKRAAWLNGQNIRDGNEPAFTLAEVRDGTGWPEGARFRMVRDD